MKEFSDLELHEIISYIKMIPYLFQSTEAIAMIDFKKLCQVRNKIAHCKVLSEEEHSTLYIIHDQLLET